MHRLDEALRERIDRLAIFGGARDDLVVDVGDVTNVRDLVAAVAQITTHHVEHGHHAGVTDMQKVVNSHATHVHAHVPRRDRLQLLLFARQ